MSQIVQDVEIAEALLDSYLKSLDQADLTAAILRVRDTRLDNDAAIGAADQVFPEIWRRLDAARAAAAATGRDVSYYDNIRAYVGAGAAFGITGVTTFRRLSGGGAKIARGNDEGVRAARDAIRVFRGAFHDHPWHVANEPVPELRNGRSIALVFSVFGMILAVIAFVAVYTH